MPRLKSLLRSLSLTSVIAAVILLGWSGAAAFIFISEIQGGNAGDTFGAAVACNQSTVLVGAPKAPFSTTPNAGAAYVVDGLTGVTAPLIYPPVPTSGVGVANAGLGTSVTFLDDVSDDTRPELVVGIPGYGSSGAAAIYFDSQSVPSVFLNGLQFNERFGTSVLGATGVTNPSVPKLFVGAPQDPSGGRVDVFTGVSSFSQFQIFPTVNDGATGFGETLALLGDIDGDTLRDIAISAQVPGSRSVYIYKFTGTTFVALLRLDNANLANKFGASIADVGDVNGDGVDDVLIGAPPLATGVGHAYLYSGLSLQIDSPSLLCDITGPGSNDGFGSTVAAVGTGAGNLDYEFLVGAPGYGGGAGAIFGYAYQGGTCVRIDQEIARTVGLGLGTSLSPGLFNSCFLHSGEFNDVVVGTTSDQGGTNAGSVRFYQTDLTTPTPTPTATPTPLVPLRARLSFRLDRLGNFTLRNSYNIDPGTGCELILYERVVVRGNRAAVHEVGRVKVGGSLVNFSLAGLPKTVIENDAVPEVHMVTVTSCGGTLTQSNVYARYLNCGLGTGVSSRTWSTRFRSKFRKKYQ